MPRRKTNNDDKDDHYSVYDYYRSSNFDVKKYLN